MRPRLAPAVLLTLAMAGAAIAFFAPAWARAASERVELAIPLHPTSLLTFVALDQGYFSAQGVDLTVKTYPTGKISLQEGMLSGTADFAWTTDVPVALAGFHRTDFRVIGVGLWSDNINKIVARKDRNIHRPEDLRGKRIATQKGSSIHYFLHLFLLKHNLSERDVTLTFLEADELPSALAEGTIDAFAMREPFVSSAQTKMNENIVVFEAPGLYEQVEVLVARKALLDRRPEVARRMLAAMLEAERFAIENPRESAAICARFLDIGPETIEALLPSFRPQVSLSQSWLVLTEAEARWAMKTGLVQGEAMPNYLEVIDFRGLGEVKPEAVTIIH